MHRVPASLLALALIAAGSGCHRSRGTAFDGYAFVATAGSPSVAVVDLTSFVVTRQIPLPSRPVQIVSDPDRKKLYVMGEGGPGGLSILNTESLQSEGSLWVGDNPVRIRLSTKGELLYVLDGQGQALRWIDLRKSSASREIRFAKPPVDFDLAPDGRWACVSLASGELAIVDLAGASVTATVRVGREPGAVAIRFDGRQAFVANRADRTVSAVDLAGGRLIAHLPLDLRPEGLRFKPDGGELFVAGGDGSVVVIISAYRDEVDQPLLAGAEPRDLAVTRDSRLLFVANSGSNTVSVIQIDDRRTLAAVPVGREPHRVVLTPDEQWVLVLNRGSGDMAAIRTLAVTRGRERIRALFTMTPVGSQPVDLAVQAR